MNHFYLAAIAAALALNATAATETYTLNGTPNVPIVIPAAKAGLTRVDLGLKVVLNGVLTVNNQSGVAQAASVDLTLAYTGLPFGNSSRFSAYQTWPVGVTTTSGFGLIDTRGVSYTSNLAPWQNPATYTCNATATTGGTLPVGITPTGTIAPNSTVTLTVTYTYDCLPAIKKARK